MYKRKLGKIYDMPKPQHLKKSLMGRLGESAGFLGGPYGALFSVLPWPPRRPEALREAFKQLLKKRGI